MNTNDKQGFNLKTLIQVSLKGLLFITGAWAGSFFPLIIFIFFEYGHLPFQLSQLLTLQLLFLVIYLLFIWLLRRSALFIKSYILIFLYAAFFALVIQIIFPPF